MDPAAILDALDPEQRAVAEAVRGPVCVLAGAGTGKTRAITHRIAYAVGSGQVPLSEVLAVTFTARAAAEMRSRLRDLGVGAVQARTFHAAALRQLQYFYPRAVGAALPGVVESKLRLLADAASRAGRPLAAPQLRDVASELEWGKSTLASPGNYAARAVAAGREPPLPPAEIAELWAGYEQARTAAGVLDFEELLLTAVGLIEGDERVAAQVRGRYRFFVVDEYQDVTPLQQRLLRAWAGDREDVCVVGDAGQTIYTFTGASPSYLLDFPKEHPDATVVRLVRDYRSTPQVVELANAVRSRGPAREQLPLVAQRPAGPAPTFTEHPDEPAEAAAVAAQCRRLIDAGVPAAEIAVLYRMNAQSETYEQALAEAGVGYLVRGGVRFFERPEVRSALVLLRGARFAPVEEGQDLRSVVAAALSTAGWTETPPTGRGAARERWDSLAALVRLAEDLAARGVDLEGFLAELTDRAAAQHAPPVDGVTLATLHAAKGLEWQAVFLVGLVEGTLPISHADTPDSLADERRLFYVGVTRAREHLAVSWALSRSAGGRGNRRPSRFLDGLRPVAPAPPRQRRPARSAVDPQEGGPLFERLRAWRLERSRELRQPAFCVFTDATLGRIAAARPGTRAELAAVPGVGSGKLASYGDDVLGIVGEQP